MPARHSAPQTYRPYPLGVPAAQRGRSPGQERPTGTGVAEILSVSAIESEMQEQAHIAKTQSASICLVSTLRLATCLQMLVNLSSSVLRRF